MKRRVFIKSSVVAASASGLMTGCEKGTSKSTKSSIRGFIISDAHIGWNNEGQPSKENQKSAISTIKNYFGELDLVFDTGDVHHGDLKTPQKNEARAFWLEEMAGKFPRALFHYVPGNHELARGIGDVETTVTELGSIPMRPYYSFDYKGIHFISLPQLQDTILITDETINWLKKDLEINSEKTTLVFSHNSLKGTTSAGGSTIYRVTINSEAVMDLLDSHGQVLAWFHGHNHQYEIVNKTNRLYVSNGRIGGFNPPQHWGDFGQGHLGGVYFEIGPKGLIVKCFSATENDFFENLGKPHLSNRINQKTTFNVNDSFNFYSGHGLIHGNNKYLHHNHYLTEKKAQLMLLKNNSTSINTNYDLSFETVFTHPTGARNKVLGYHITPKSVVYAKAQNGLLIESSENNEVNIKLPVEKYKYENYLSRSGYYRCGLGSKYFLDIETDNSDLEFLVEYKVMDKRHKVCYQNSQFKAIDVISRRQRFIIDIPVNTEVKPIDHKTYLFVSITIKNTPDRFVINRIQILPRDNESSIGQVSIGDRKLQNDTITQVETNQSKYSEINIEEVNNPKTLYIKTPVIDWQIRNATATIVKNGFKINALRNDYLKQSQVVITPTNQRPFYINELFGISQCSIIFTDRGIRISGIKKQGLLAKVVLISEVQPREYQGIKLEKAMGYEYHMIIDDNEAIITL